MGSSNRGREREPPRPTQIRITDAWMLPAVIILRLEKEPAAPEPDRTRALSGPHSDRFTFLWVTLTFLSLLLEGRRGNDFGLESGTYLEYDSHHVGVRHLEAVMDT